MNFNIWVQTPPLHRHTMLPPKHETRHNAEPPPPSAAHPPNSSLHITLPSALFIALPWFSRTSVRRTSGLWLKFRTVGVVITYKFLTVFVQEWRHQHSPGRIPFCHNYSTLHTACRKQTASFFSEWFHLKKAAACLRNFVFGLVICVTLETFWRLLVTSLGTLCVRPSLCTRNNDKCSASQRHCDTFFPSTPASVLPCQCHSTEAP